MFPADAMYPIFLAATGFAAVLLMIPRMIPLALRYGLVDNPDIRRIHNSPTPLCGGIAIAIPVAITLIVFVYLSWGREISFPADPAKLIAFLVGMCWILFLGIIDDKRSLSWKEKLAGQAIGVLILMSAGHSARSAYLPFIGPVDFGFTGPIVFGLAVIFITNAINLIDGIDGLAAGVSLSTSLVYGIVGCYKGDVFACTLGFVLSGSLLGFMIFNLPPARVFLGDAGSLMLGFVLGTLAISAATSMSPGQRSATFTSLLAPLFPLSLALLDAFLSILRRWIRGGSICAPDTDHLHHRLMTKFKNPKIVVLTMCGFSGILGIVSILVALAPKEEFSIPAAALFVLTCLMVATGILLLYRTDNLTRVLRERRHFKFLDEYLRYMSTKLALARSGNDVIESLESGVKDLGFDSVTITQNQSTVRHWISPSPLHPGSSRVSLVREFRESGLALRALIPLHERKSYQDHIEHTWARVLEICEKRLADLTNEYHSPPKSAETEPRHVVPHHCPSRTELPGRVYRLAQGQMKNVPGSIAATIAPFPAVAMISQDGLSTERCYELHGLCYHREVIIARPQEGHVTEDLLDFPVMNAGLDWCIDSVEDWLKHGNHCRWLACLNPHSYAEALKKEEFREAIRTADWVIPDGAGIVLASRILGGHISGRVTGSDIFLGLNERLNQNGGASAFFLGSTPENLDTICSKLESEYPKIRIAGTYSPPFKPVFSDREIDGMIEAVNTAEPDILWVGMTAPKQEIWIHRHKDRLNVKFAGAIGAVFDFYSGRVQRSHPVFRRLGLEWLPRLMRDPRRLWRRTFVSAPVFLWHLLAAKMNRGPAVPDSRKSSGRGHSE